MDIGQKTLGQLSAERNEKKYITLETAAKLSGYTKEYLERLCRLGKIEYRLWNNGQYVPELESLLRETHTILVSFEGIQLVNKEETMEAPATRMESVPSTPSSESVATAQSDSRRDELTFVVRPVLSRVEHQLREAKKSPDLAAQEGQKTEPRLPPVFGGAHIAVPVISGEGEEWRSVLKATGAVSVDRLPTVFPKTSQVSVPNPSEESSVIIKETSDAQDSRNSADAQSGAQSESETIVHPAIHLEIFDAETLARQRANTKASAVAETPTISASPDSLPSPEVSSAYPSTFLQVEPERHLVPVEPHPITKSPVFNLALISLVALGVVLIGYFGSPPASESFRTAESFRNDLVASVAESFSDEVIVQESSNGNIVITPVFKSGPGKEKEFILTPVQK